MKKSDRISALVEAFEGDGQGAFDARYRGYFRCFNRGEYYEAHDVLEDLWLETAGGDRDFYKGLIQFAGAFVHLQKHFGAPHHAKHGRRLHPAARLFQRADAHLKVYAPEYLHLDVAEVGRLCALLVEQLSASEFRINPWSPRALPQLALRSS